MNLQTVLYFLMWGGFFFVMMRFGCGSHIMGHGHHHDRSDSDSNRDGSADKNTIASDKDVDPVCGKTIATANAKSSVYGGQVYHFCSAACRKKFEAEPTAYIKGSVMTHEGGKHHGCC